MNKPLKDMTDEELAQELKEAQEWFDKTGYYVRLAETTYEICKRQGKIKPYEIQNTRV